MDEHDPGEVEEAFRHLWRVGPVGEDWAAQAALFTEDAVYIDHYYGRRTPAEFLTWCTQLMNEEFPEIYTVYEWHVVDGNRVVANRPRLGDPASQSARG
jgi:SnoaL-like domain